MLKIIQGDALQTLRRLKDNCIQTCVTSPPYWGLRDYGVPGQLGLEKSPNEYVAALVEIFHEVRRVLKPDGTLWLNLGDSYVGGGGKIVAHDNSNFIGTRIMTWLPLTRPDKGKVWLNSKADFWRIIAGPTETVIWYGDTQQAVLETPEQIIAMLEKS